MPRHRSIKPESHVWDQPLLLTIQRRNYATAFIASFGGHVVIRLLAVFTVKGRYSVTRMVSIGEFPNNPFSRASP
jgi:hypothetical protein